MEVDDAEFHQRLPHQIILNNILSRLPVKSLLRSKCVCNQWRPSISTPQFIKLHLSQSQCTTTTTTTTTTTITTTHRLAVLESHNPPASIALRSIDLEIHPDHAVNVTELHNNFKYSYPNSKVLGSCNGLLLIGISEKTYIVWNPSIREYEHLWYLPYFHSNVYILSGLGYDRLVDQYKVFMAFWNIESDRENMFMYWCSSKILVGSRNKKVEFPYTISKDTPATVMNGVPHWLVNHDRGRGEGEN